MMLFKSSINALCAIILATQLIFIYGQISTPQDVFKSTANIVREVPNVLTACDVNYTFTKVPLNDLVGKYYLQKLSRAASDQRPRRCASNTFETLVSNDVGLDTHKTYINNVWSETHYLVVALDNGQLRTAYMGDPSSFRTTNIVYFNSDIGVILCGCSWNNKTVNANGVLVFTKTENPSAADMRTLMREARKAKLPTYEFYDVDNSNCTFGEFSP